jgi:ABC-type transporter Mla MlaB component
MGGVTESDSALIALLVGWWRRAEREGVAIRIEQPPAAVVQLAQIYGVDSLLFS